MTVPELTAPTFSLRIGFMRINRALALLLIANAVVFAQHEHHHMGMNASAARLQVEDDAAAQVLTLRLGPVNLPAHADHMMVAQPGYQFFRIAVDGWLVAYHPRLTDERGNTLPGVMLHHVAVFNTRRSDFLCPSHEEHIFGAGAEMKDWVPVPGFGYRVHAQDRIRVSTMFHNPTDADHPQTYLEVKIDYQLTGKAMLKNVYPAWFDVQQCRDSDYDLKPGRSVTAGTMQVGYSGRLLGVGGHMHDYGRQLVFENATRGENIATLNAELDPSGHLVSIPIALFLDRGGYHFNKGDLAKVTATYDNSSGQDRPMGAMGMVVGFFLPDDDSEMWQRLVRVEP
jgi:hypothetical protein